MTSHLPSPPASPSISPESAQTEDSLAAPLDTLLTSYLSLLHTYTTLRADLSKTFSSGFFALAQANRNANSTLGPGRRYGEEGFDERMKAGRLVEISRGRTTESEPHESNDEDEHEGETPQHKAKPTGGGDMDDHLQGEEKLLQPAQDLVTSLYPPHTYSIVPAPPSSPPPRNPLNWYGILVPPSLRSAQVNFTTALSSNIPGLLSTVSAMRHVEDEIRSLREQLGMLHDYEYDGPAKENLDGKDETQAVRKEALGRDGLSVRASAPGEIRQPQPEAPMSNPTLPLPKFKPSSLLSASPSSAGLPSRVLKLD